MMKEFGYPWTLFLITDDVGKSYNRMTWEQLKEMADSGAVTIANHTLSHPKLHNLPTRAREGKRNYRRLIKPSSIIWELIICGLLIRMEIMMTK